MVAGRGGGGYRLKTRELSQRGLEGIESERKQRCLWSWGLGQVIMHQDEEEEGSWEPSDRWLEESHAERTEPPSSSGARSSDSPRVH